MIEIALCDDDRYLLGKLEGLLYELGERHKLHIDVDCFEDGTTLLERVKKGKRFDIIYMDIQIGEMDGLETAYRIREFDWDVLLAYVTSYESYMKEAFKSAPIAFIIKPIKVREFEDTFLYMLKKLTKHNVYYCFRYWKTEYRIPLCDILYFESNLREVRIIWKNGVLKEYNKLDVIERKLEEGKEHFLRIHKSFLVNYHHITGIGYDRVIMNTGKELPLSRKYQKQVDEILRVQMEKIK